VSVALVIGVQVAIVGIVLFALTPSIRRRWPQADAFLALGRTAAVVIGISLIGYSVAGGQTPMSNTPNPVADTVTSVSTGYRLYEANCAACHGVDGNGGGPRAATTPITPPSLTAHLTQHSDGDLFYWISNGLPGGMPAWSAQIAETDRWNIVNYLRSINGQGPTARPSSAAPSTPPSGSGGDLTNLVGVVVPVGFATLMGGWVILPGRRRRRPKADDEGMVDANRSRRSRWRPMF